MLTSKSAKTNLLALTVSKSYSGGTHCIEKGRRDSSCVTLSFTRQTAEICNPTKMCSLGGNHLQHVIEQTVYERINYVYVLKKYT